MIPLMFLLATMFLYLTFSPSPHALSQSLFLFGAALALVALAVRKLD